MSNPNVYFSRVAFTFLIFCVVSSGHVSEILSCQMRERLHKSALLRHLVGFSTMLVFIMMEGGWSFNSARDDKAPTNWSSGNVLETLPLALGIYLIFMASSKSRFWPNVAFFSTILLLYTLNTQREFWLVRDEIKPDTSQNILIAEYVLTIVAFLILIGGVIDYVRYQKRKFGDKFSMWEFLIQGHECAFERKD